MSWVYNSCISIQIIITISLIVSGIEGIQLKDSGNEILFNLKEHEKVSRLAVYCNALSLLVFKIFPKICKIYILLIQHKSWRHKQGKYVHWIQN